MILLRTLGSALGGIVVTILAAIMLIAALALIAGCLGLSLYAAAQATLLFINFVTWCFGTIEGGVANAIVGVLAVLIFVSVGWAVLSLPCRYRQTVIASQEYTGAGTGTFGTGYRVGYAGAGLFALGAFLGSIVEGWNSSSSGDGFDGYSGKPDVDRITDRRAYSNDMAERLYERERSERMRAETLQRWDDQARRNAEQRARLLDTSLPYGQRFR